MSDVTWEKADGFEYWGFVNGMLGFKVKYCASQMKWSAFEHDAGDDHLVSTAGEAGVLKRLCEGITAAVGTDYDADAVHDDDDGYAERWSFDNLVGATVVLTLTRVSAGYRCTGCGMQETFAADVVEPRCATNSHAGSCRGSGSL